tara:strand:+ start:492 stop:749 length:258 start_codon:yes stop_codon:yes gene_type:complete
LLLQEQRFFDNLVFDGKERLGYNINRIAGSLLGMRFEWSDEAKKRTSLVGGQLVRTIIFMGNGIRRYRGKSGVKPEKAKMLILPN